MATETRTFKFQLSLYELLSVGIEGLNEILDDEMEAEGLTEQATDIGYKVFSVDPKSNEIIIEASYTPEEMDYLT
jgi:hypothetical protein